jgi:purine catabolism regulator
VASVTGRTARAGLSDPVDLAEVAGGLDQACRALRRAAPGQVVAFDQVADGEGLLALLRGADAMDVARAFLAPLVVHDDAHGAALVPSVVAWLANDASFDRAARAMGVHRHTLRERVTLAERVLGVDLTTFEARARLWLALRVAGLL